MIPYNEMKHLKYLCTEISDLVLEKYFSNSEKYFYVQIN